MHRGPGGNLLNVAAAQLVAHAPSAPPRVLSSQLANQCLQLGLETVRSPMRTTGALLQAEHAVLGLATPPHVDRLPGHAVAGGDLAHWRAITRLQHRPVSLLGPPCIVLAHPTPLLAHRNQKTRSSNGGEVNHATTTNRHASCETTHVTAADDGVRAGQSHRAQGIRFARLIIDDMCPLDEGEGLARTCGPNYRQRL